MTQKPMTQIIRELISANFPIEIIGTPKAQSQFGVPYITFVNGYMPVEGEAFRDDVLDAHDGQTNTWAMEWISTLPKDHDVAVWRSFPEEQICTFKERREAKEFELGRKLTAEELADMPKMDQRTIRWRLHTMTRTKLIAYVNEMKLPFEIQNDQRPERLSPQEDAA